MQQQIETFFSFPTGVEWVRGRKTFAATSTFESLLNYPNEAFRIQLGQSQNSICSMATTTEAGGSLMITTNPGAGLNWFFGPSSAFLGGKNFFAVTATSFKIDTGTLFETYTTPHQGSMTSIGGVANLRTGATESSLLIGGASSVSYKLQFGNVAGSSTVLSANAGFSQALVTGAPGGFTTTTAGTHQQVSSLVIRPITITAGTATVTTSASLYISGPTTGAATNQTIWSDAGVNRFDGTLILGTSTSSAGTLNLDGTANVWVFTGTTTTWTLPSISSKTGWEYLIKNRGSGAITLNSNIGGNDIYNTSAANSLTVNAGEAYTLINDGTYWLII